MDFYELLKVAVYSYLIVGLFFASFPAIIVFLCKCYIGCCKLLIKLAIYEQDEIGEYDDDIKAIQKQIDSANKLIDDQQKYFEAVGPVVFFFGILIIWPMMIFKRRK